MKFVGQVNKVYYEYKLRQFRRYEGPLFVVHSQDYIVDDIFVTMDRQLFEPSYKDYYLDKLGDDIRDNLLDTL